MKYFTAETQRHREKKGKKQEIESKKNVSCRFRFLLVLSLCLCVSAVNFHRISAQSGVLIPSSLTDKPDAGVLSLQMMNIEITIDNQHATVKVLQIFDNRTSETLEGKYVFDLPQQSAISDFAIWENDTRIPGVMMEKRRANQVYGEIKQAQIDPGILQTTGDDESAGGFSAKVFPINSYGSKRLEMEYTETLAVENLASHFSFPLKPSHGEAQTVGEFNLKIRVLNDFPIAPITSEHYPLQITNNEPNNFEAEFHAANIKLENDFAFDYQINAPESILSFIAYRAPERISAYDLRDPKLANQTADGFFQAQAIFNQPENDTRQPKRLILLLDTSLSMHGEKLVRAVEAVDYFLHNLNEQDQFNLILFNDESNTFAPKPISANAENVEKAMQFLRTSTLGGGTNLKKSLRTAIEQANNFSEGERNIVLISDANPTLGTTKFDAIESLFDNGKNTAKLYAFAFGNDANQSLLESLTEKSHGYFAQARETEDIAIALKTFFEKIGAPVIEKLKIDSSEKDNFYQVYATSAESFDGSGFGFVGRYKTPKQQTNVNVSASYGAETLNLAKQIILPELDETHAHLPRVWARARVDALLDAMNRDGEREDYIAEIIRLSEKYKFVTPYTAFLAAPRAMLRPRLIQPGDPTIRVKTDESIKEVFAVLPFGETLPLKFLETEKVWQVRFLAPAWMPDGAYRCRLLLTDKDGNSYAEEKTFVVDSRAPKVKINLPKDQFKAGEEILLKVAADSDTRQLSAKFYGAKPIRLTWSNEHKTNIGKLQIPENLSAGNYVLTVTAEDFAHNLTTEEMQIEILVK